MVATAPERSTDGHRERLRRAFLATGGEAMDEADVLELLLCFAIPRQDVRPLAERLLAHFGSLARVLAAEQADLRSIKGVGERALVLLRLVSLLRREASPAAATVVPCEPHVDQPDLFGGKAAVAAASRPANGSSAVPEAPSTGAAPEASQPAADDAEPTASARATQPRLRPPSPRRSTDLFAKAALKEAIALLPQLPDTDSLQEIGRFLREQLPFNAEQTRQRQAEYITRRMFPTGRADTPLLAFARQFADTPALRDVCFYRFCLAEPFMRRVMEELLLPTIVAGELPRAALTDFVTAAYPASRSVREAVLAIIAALEAGGVARADRQRLTFTYRPIPLPAFAFVVESEFPDPGIHELAKLEGTAALRWLLWRPAAVLPALYELRNQGLVKVSEIDRLRQFTTRFTLDEAIARLTPERV